MNEIKQGNNAHGGPHDGRVHDNPSPYWKRAHLDWRMWAGALLLIFLMIAYVMSDNLAWRPGNQPQSPLPIAIGK
jgi:hypothetical protein